LALSRTVVPALDVVTASTNRHVGLLIALGMITSISNVIDRSVVNILAEPIKRDLGLSDTQLGLLTGFSFALLYSVMGLPIARYVDRPKTDRPMVIAACVALWSAMTMACGAITSFGQLLTARALVAIGEAGSGPAIVTLMNHYVTPWTRSRTFAIYGLGPPIGTLLGIVVGGFLVDLIGWRLTFVAVGAPGLVLAVLIWWLMPEPRRAARAVSSPAAGRQPSLADNARLVVRSPSLRWLVSSAAMTGLILLGLPAWTGVYLIRVVGLTPTRTGLVLGLAFGIGGALGTYLGGLWADQLSKRDPGRALMPTVWGLLIGIPAAFPAFLSGDWRIFAVSYGLIIFGASAYLGPMFSVLQLLVSERYRATTVVITFAMLQLVGAGLGPLLIGMGSDVLRSRFGTDSLRFILLGGHVGAFVPALLYLRTRYLIRHEVAGAAA